MNTEKRLRSQHNRAKENNSYKTKTNFRGFYTEVDPKWSIYGVEPQNLKDKAPRSGPGIE